MKNKTQHHKSPVQANKTSDFISNNTPRRKVIKGLLVSGGVVSGSSMLPQKWTRPIIDSVILPSHAATTDDTGNLPGDVTTTPTPAVNYYYGLSRSGAQFQDKRSKGGNLFAARILDTLVPTAHAGYAPYIAYACIAITGDTYTARVVWSTNGDYADFDNISGSVGVTKNLPSPPPGYGFCAGSNVGSATMLVDNVTAASCSCAISGDATTVTITVNEGQCQPPFISECQD